ncbi:hypothetical protein SAMN05421773_107222 [Streptomyces aidingensis]|uniref:Uncharacterized protein n=1 Tax=Streptomyces aidingensis TaxID=910347 RepID=A0A1I1NCU0_9ACTN|nr:hypothetical protein SAMN05421773_107222 [Streptomyces aidingensis]
MAGCCVRCTTAAALVNEPAEAADDRTRANTNNPRK